MDFLGGQWIFWGASGFSDSLPPPPPPPGPVVATVQCQGLKVVYFSDHVKFNTCRLSNNLSFDSV